MNKFEKIYLPLFGAIITVLLNIIMFIQTFITKANYDVFSNFFVIIVVLILYRVNYYAVKIGMERRVRLEYYGILFLCTFSLMRLINRLTLIPFYINAISFIFAFGFGTFALMIAIIRLRKH
ncbi:hypothetical protein ACETAC_05840 [Aceticella autotrophica]|uniref:Uncharacterized protein n=1 Tax=Aceticella autotrophica TaxID=2755338 RepID=A0A974Y2L6_9THEO|nr:hypothetical protein [Aceticella autotrophica]QSZ26443.1 hypothetical protein ACETAC_05750 [Aceticella autotrophica]QSZ26452.1 hypothetical protein ACETAC_05840 [Aceticella autotrophica]